MTYPQYDWVCAKTRKHQSVWDIVEARTQSAKVRGSDARALKGGDGFGSFRKDLWLLPGPVAKSGEKMSWRTRWVRLCPCSKFFHPPLTAPHDGSFAGQRSQCCLPTRVSL